VPEYTLRIRRFSPETGEPAYWEDFGIELEGHRSVLDGILQAKDLQDGSIGIRCSCRAAICGSCGVRINGRPGLACHMHLEKAAKYSRDGKHIVVEPMGNMPVIRDLVTDMDSVHWKKIRRVTPWLLPDGDPPEREYIVPKESMVDITQAMACIQCGACVSDCLSMEVDPLFIGPAALAKAYRFVGDPRDGEQAERLTDLAEDPHGMYDCTHCFNCIEACPKGVAPMNQIMRLRRIAGTDHGIVDRNNGHRHEKAFSTLVRNGGLLHEAELLPRSYGGDSWFGKFHPKAGAELADSLPVITRALLRRKVTPMAALKPHKIPDVSALRRIFDTIGAEPRHELNLYMVPPDDDEATRAGVEGHRTGAGSETAGATDGGTAASTPPERSPNT
jgi:succinate dehydrogenase / fumarate reductase iron-sulfur subunit